MYVLEGYWFINEKIGELKGWGVFNGVGENILFYWDEFKKFSLLDLKKFKFLFDRGFCLGFWYGFVIVNNFKLDVL